MGDDELVVVQLVAPALRRVAAQHGSREGARTWLGLQLGVRVRTRVRVRVTVTVRVRVRVRARSQCTGRRSCRAAVGTAACLGLGSWG